MLAIIVIHFVTVEHKTRHLQKDNYKLHMVSVMEGGKGMFVGARKVKARRTRKHIKGNTAQTLTMGGECKPYTIAAAPDTAV